MEYRIEALADAIAKLNGWHDPESRAYQLRNPLLLRAFSLSRLQDQDADGYRVFSSALGGYRAGLNDLFIKLGGRSRADLGPEATLLDLLGCYGELQVTSVFRGLQHPVAVRQIVQFLLRALKCSDGTIYAGMPMAWFLQTRATEGDAALAAPEREAAHG